MRPSATIYKSGKSGQSGQTLISLPLASRIFYTFIRGTGTGLTAFAIISFLFAFGPIIQQEVGYYFNKDANSEENGNYETLVDTSRAEETLEVQKEAESYNVNSYFSVVIPKIGASANITANVDATNKDEYLSALKQGVAHAKGTYFPEQGKRILLFSHSTDSPLNIARYNAVFYLLRKLEPKDLIIVFFADKKYVYEVETKTITDPSDTSWLIDRGDSETLVLLTCDPPGTTWNRLVVEAKPLK